MLVVEDDRAVGELIAGALSDEPGYSAIHVLTPALALETIKHAVLFETGSGAESVGEFRRCGIASYVAKPFKPLDVVRRVKRLATNAGAL